MLIWVLRNHRPTIEFLHSLVSDTKPVCSVITEFEVWAGVRRGEEAKTRRLFEPFEVVTVSREIADLGAEYWRNFQRSGATLGKMDVLIAATARVEDLTLVTYNRVDFPMDDITLYDPMPSLP